MQRLENPVLQKFIDELVEAFKRENEERKWHVEKQQELDIPFLISSLYQSFKNNVDNYKDFINDLNVYSDYDICVDKSQNEWNGIVDVKIVLVKYDFSNEHDYDDNHDFADYHYTIQFETEDRNWGYCQCTPDMPDYREDKGCCGHGCDACFCEFDLYKVTKISHGSWQGDEHDYWDFEDDFYKTDEELLLKKQEEDKKCEIERCKKYIEEYTKKLSELLGGEK